MKDKNVANTCTVAYYTKQLDMVHWYIKNCVQKHSVTRQQTIKTKKKKTLDS